MEVSLEALVKSWHAVIGLYGPTVANRVLGLDVHPRLLGRLLSAGDGMPLTERMLAEIPSETTPAERNFLHGFFSRCWNGTESVLEIGPFLGGTSRAIAMGMLLNPARTSSSWLYTFDRFRDYWDLAMLRQSLAPLLSSGSLSSDDLSALDSADGFLELYKRIHGSQPYGALIRPARGVLPRFPGDEQEISDTLRLPEGVHFDAVFVDGCKTWYGTKSFMLQAVQSATPDAFFIFQDYAWYSCFFIPTFVGLFRDCFELISYVDATYAFQLRRVITPEEIESRFPDRATDLPPGVLERVFEDLLEDAVERSDANAVFIHSLQQAVALSYIGERGEAQRRIEELRLRPGYACYAALLKQALESPMTVASGEIRPIATAAS